MSTNLDNQRPFYSELTAEETTALNGGWYCRYVYVPYRVCYWYGCFIRWIRVIRCY